LGGILSVAGFWGARSVPAQQTAEILDLQARSPAAGIFFLQGESGAVPGQRSFTFEGVQRLRLGPDVRIDVDLRDADLADALKEVFKLAKRDYAVEGDPPASGKITLRAKNVTLSSVLDLLTESAGLGWSREIRNGVERFRVGKSVRSRVSSTMSFALPQGAMGALRPFTAEVVGPAMSNLTGGLNFSPSTVHSTFRCSHCNGQTTIVRSQSQPRCPKCERTFQRDWQYCPADGTKRPATPAEFQFCPICGKKVQSRDPASVRDGEREKDKDKDKDVRSLR
jgi:hypothetical protein